MCVPAAATQDYVATPDRDYHVVRFDLNVDWYNVFKNGNLNWTGRNVLTIQSKSDTLSVIELDAAKLNILGVYDSTAGVRLSFFATDTTKNLLYISLGRKLKTGDTAQIAIDYKFEGSVDITRLGFDGGFGIVSPLNSKQKKTAYTSSEPEFARYWMPCNDIPIDRSFSRKTIRVPRGISAVSNGTRVDSLSDDSSSTFIWDLHDPMPTYLQAITASEYSTYKDTITRSDGSAFPIEYYVWQKYLGDNGRVYVFDSHKEMMKYYQSGLFFDFPYEKYGVVCVPGYGGGMENATITTCDVSWIDYYTYIGLAHELGHSWLGDYITCAGWKDLWINEGGATWCEDMWYRYSEGESKYYQLLDQNKRTLFWSDLALTPVYNLDHNALFYAALSYNKAGWVYQMMFDAFGSDFVSDIRELLNKYKLTSITTEQFRDFIKSKHPDYPISWDTFFKQWLLDGGYPKVTVSMESQVQPDGNSIGTTEIHQTQTGSGVPSVFEIPVKVIYTSYDGGTITTVHYMTNRDTVFYDTLPTRVTNVAFWNYSFLGDIYVNKASKADEISSNKFRVYPNPAVRGGLLNIEIPSDMITSDESYYTLTDEAGNTVASGSETSGAIQVPSGLSYGTYFLTVENGLLQFREKVQIK